MKHLIILSASLLLLSSCFNEIADCEKGDDNELTYIISSADLTDGMGNTRSSATKIKHNPHISNTDDIVADISVMISPYFQDRTKSTLKEEMYDEFAFGIDEINNNGKIVRNGIDNEKMSNNSGKYRSSHLYSKKYLRGKDSDMIMFWGYAPYNDDNITRIVQGSRIINLNNSDPTTQEDLIAVSYSSKATETCMSPMEKNLTFTHILSSIHFSYYSSPGISGAIDEIRIKGVRMSGSFDMYNYVWQDIKDDTVISICVEQEISPDHSCIDLLGEDNKLLFIPQSFSESAAIEIDYSLKTDSADGVRKGTLVSSLSELGDWEGGISIEYIISFKENLQTKINKFSPDTLFWEGNESAEISKSAYIFGRNLDAAEISVELSGDDVSHWQSPSVDYSDDGETVQLSIAPVSENFSDAIITKLSFRYPAVSEAGSADIILVHKNPGTENQLFAATKKSDFKESNALMNGYVAVRNKREGKVYLYLNDEGKWGSNNVLGLPDGDGFHDWSANFNELETIYGLSFNYDNASHLLTISVSDYDKYVSHLDSVISLDCTLNSGRQTISISIKLMPDFSIDGLEDFYVGMKRTPDIKGFCGEIYMSTATSSDKLKYGSNRISLSSEKIPIQNLFAYSGGSTKLLITSTDDFNDSDFCKEILTLDPKPELKLSDDRYFIHGDEIMATINYYDKTGRMLDPDCFDPQAFSTLLVCDFNFKPSGSKPFIGSGSYKVNLTENGYESYLADVPESYLPQNTYYAVVDASVKYNPALHSAVETVLPAFDANGIHGCIASIDDYLSLNSAEMRVVSSYHSFTFGVKSTEDLVCSVLPISTHSYENCCISAAVTDKDKGNIVLTLFDSDVDNMQLTHSVGRHRIEIGTVNKHCGKLVKREDIYPCLDVYIHTTVGAGTYLSDYSSDECFTAYFFGDALPDVDKCSISDVAGENFVRTVSADYSGDYSVYKWNSLAIKAEIQSEDYGAFLGEDNPYLVIRFSVNTLGSTEYEIENARNIINNVWNDQTGNALIGVRGLFGPLSGMRIYNGLKCRTENIKAYDLVDDSGQGYYFVHLLEDKIPDSRGWLNVLYGIGMPQYGYSL